MDEADEYGCSGVNQNFLPFSVHIANLTWWVQYPAEIVNFLAAGCSLGHYSTSESFYQSTPSCFTYVGMPNNQQLYPNETKRSYTCDVFHKC